MDSRLAPAGRSSAPRRRSVLPRRVALARHRLAVGLARGMRSLSARNLVSLLGAIVALTTALSIPIGYGIIGYFKEAGALTYKAELSAARAAQYIYAPDAPWKYDTDQLAAISEIRTSTAAPIIQRIVDTKGAQMMQKGEALAWPTFTRGAPVVASGAIVGRVEVIASLRPLLSEVGFVALGSFLLAVAAYLAFAVLPLKVIDRSLGELELANAKFRQQNVLLDAALANMVQSLAMFDAQERLVLANNRYAEVFGQDPAEIKPGMTLREIVELRVARGLYSGMTVEEILGGIRQRIAVKQVSNLILRPGDGRILSAAVQPRADGGWVVTHQDITERENLNSRLAQQNELLKQREEELKAQNERFDAALENMFQGLAMFDPQERLILANDRFAEMYGLRPERVKPGMTLREVLQHRIDTGLYTGATIEHALAIMRERVVRKKVSHLTSKLGDGRTIVVSIRPRADGGWVTTHQDITERETLSDQLARQNELLQQREEELEAQNTRFNSAIDNMSQGMCLFDAERRVVFANRRYAELYALSVEQLKPGTTLREILEARVARGSYKKHVDGAKFVEDGIANFNEEVSQVLELADGRFISVLRRPMPDGSLVSTHEDITEREKLKAKLEQQNEQLDAALNNMSQGLCMYDAEQRVVIANGRYAEIYGLTPEQVQPGTTLRQIVEYRIANGGYAGGDPGAYIKERLAAFDEASTKVYRLSDGRDICVSRQPMRGGGWVTTHEDVSEREKLKARLEQQNEQLDAALNNMSQGLAMFDEGQRLVVCNRLYGAMYGLTPEQVEPGKSVRQIVEYRLANGSYSASDPREFVNMLVDRFGKLPSDIHKLADGRVVHVTYRKAAHGGHVITHEDITAREKLMAQLEQQHQLLKEQEEMRRAQNVQLDAALNNMVQGLAMFDAEQRVVIANDRYAEVYGLTPEQVKPGTPLRQIVEHRIANGCYAGRTANEVLGQMDNRRAGGKAIHHIVELGDGRSIAISVQPMADGGTVTTHQDITERQKLHAQLEQNNRLLSERTSRLQTIIDNFPGGITFLDSDLRVALCNEKARRMLDLPDWFFVDALPSLEAVFRFNASRGEFGAGDIEEQVASRMAVLRERKSHVFERERRDGTVIEVRGVPLDDGGFVTTYMDITERRRSEAKIAHMALHDALTGLANRTLLSERLEQALTRVKRGEILAIHLLDLDHFKNVNDTLGHPAGDKLLKDAADRLRTLVRETDTIARMGGDEFAILQVAVAQPADATALAHRVIEVVSEPYEIDGRQVIIGTSVGIAVGPADGLAPDQLMRNADLALYRAKDDGRGTYRFFEPEMDAQMQERRAMEYDLRKALVAGEFELHYQPVVNLETNRISGFEALIRWHHPEKGMIAPGMFIPLAEEIGFIIPLGEWVIRTACATAAGWPDHTRISVNLSPVQFRNPGLVQVVVGALAASRLPAGRLELEITESALLEDSEATLGMLYQLRELGVRIAMDDFGTGYSSLSYLQSFPFDRIKIDRSFIKDVTEGVGSLNIVRAVAALANGLGMETTAEGVETSEQLDTVRSEGCTEMQGFLFSRPRPVAEIEQLLLAQGERREDEGEASAA